MLGVDVIQDFSVIDDTLKIENNVFTALGTTIGTLSSDKFISATTAMDANDYLIYNSITGALYYDADGNGTGVAPLQIASLGVGLTLTYADFVVM
jgi:Ca2+-binding RTX toxin-like protein